LLKRNAKPERAEPPGRHRADGGVARWLHRYRAGAARQEGRPNTPDFTGRTAVVYARQSGHTTIEAMLRKAADASDAGGQSRADLDRGRPDA